MNRTEFINSYYKQYRLLEKRLIDISEYVEFSPKNYAVFSNQFVNIFLTICSEIDSLASEFCKMINDNNKKVFSGIINKIDIILTQYPHLRNWKVLTVFPFEIINFVPFAKFEANVSTWWTDYNAVKHGRTEKDENDRYNYQRANLKNVLFAMSALYILIKKMDEELSQEGTPNFNVTSELFDNKIYL